MFCSALHACCIRHDSADQKPSAVSSLRGLGSSQDVWNTRPAALVQGSVTWSTINDLQAAEHQPERKTKLQGRFFPDFNTYK